MTQKPSTDGKSWDLTRHLQSPKPRSPEKSQKSLPKTRTPEKFRTKSESPKTSQNQLFFGLFRTFSELFGGFGSGGPKLPSGDFLETFRGFGVLGSVDGGRDPKTCPESGDFLPCLHSGRT